MTDSRRTQELLAGIPMFKEMVEAHLMRLAEGAREISLKKGEYLFRKGDPSQGFYVIVSGWITIAFLSIGGKEHVIRIVGPGQSFAEAVMFLNRPYPANVQASTDARVLFIPKNIVFQCIDDDPAFARRMIAGLSQRLHTLAIELESITLRSSEQRVIGYLLQHQELMDNEQQTVHINLAVNKATIASHLNLTPETLSRILHGLAEKGLLAVEGKTIHIRNIKKLRTYGLLDVPP